jgi:uncharacterized glyoxalase superfamily protein PhnB
MKLYQLAPILRTGNLQQTISFYETALGFKSRSNFPGFASLSLQDAELMFIEPRDGFDTPQLTGSIYFFMEGVDMLWETVKDKATIKTVINNREYLMRDFSILDNNGYELVFGEDISAGPHVK